MPHNSRRILSDDTSAEARARLLNELLRLMHRGELQDALIEVWKRTCDEDRVAFLLGNSDFLASLFSRDERAALQAGAALAMMTAAEDEG